MNRVATEEPKSDIVKWCLVFILIISGLYANYFWAEQPIAFRSAGLVLVAVFALFVGVTTTKGKNVWQFVQDARVEVRKVVWPGRQETVQTTFVVVGMVLVTSILLWIIDALLFRVMSIFTG